MVFDQTSVIFRPYWLVRRPFSSQDGPPFGPNSLRLASVRPMILLFRKIACLTYMTSTISILTTQIFRFCSLFGSRSNCGSSPALGGCSAAELHSREPMFRNLKVVGSNPTPATNLPSDPKSFSANAYSVTPRVNWLGNQLATARLNVPCISLSIARRSSTEAHSDTNRRILLRIVSAYPCRYAGEG